MLPVQRQLLCCQIDAVQFVPLGQPCFCDHVAVWARIPPAAVCFGCFGQRLIVNRFQMLECQCDGTLGAGSEKLLELVVFPALGDRLFGAAVPGPFRRDALQDGLHIVGREGRNVLHCANDLELIGGAALVDIGGVRDGRNFIKVDLHSRAGLYKRLLHQV